LRQFHRGRKKRKNECLRATVKVDGGGEKGKRPYMPEVGGKKKKRASTTSFEKKLGPYFESKVFLSEKEKERRVSSSIKTPGGKFFF